MKKIIFLPIIIFTFLIMTPTVFADGEYGKVTDITKKAGDSLSSGDGTIVTNGNTTTIKYSASTFKMLEEDSSAADGNRPGPAAWIGFEVAKPDNDNDSSYKVKTPDNKVTDMKKYPYTDYVGITPENLKNNLLKGTLLTYKYSFDWNEDDDYDQFVIIEIDPKEMTLVDEDKDETLWSPGIAADTLEEQNPNTGDINILIYIALILLGGTGLVYYFKKAY